MLRPARLAAIVEKFSGIPGIIGMHGGLPPVDAFPLTDLAFGLSPMAGGGSLEITGQKDVVAAQQYCFAPNGYEPLRSILASLTERVQRPPRPASVTVTCGSTYSLDVTLDLLLERGDPLLVEEFTYSHALEAQLMPKGFDLIPVAMDDQGMVPAALEALLRRRAASGKPAPRVMYAIPSGQNPTGAAMGPGRRAEIYKVCCRHDIIIVEDDAYSWLQYPSGEGDVPGLWNIQPGFLSHDTEGRVIRLDTFSKLLGPGLRLGWITAPQAFASRAGLAVSASTLGPASLSHVYMHRLLAQWGDSGLDAFVRALQRRYARQAALAHAAASRHLSGLATWRAPSGGMFMWLRLEGLDDAVEMLDEAVEAKVAVVPGSMFWVVGAIAAAAAAEAAAPGGAPGAAGAGEDGHAGAPATPMSEGSSASSCGSFAHASEPPCPCFRVSFVSASEQELDEGFARLASAIRALKARAGQARAGAEVEQCAAGAGGAHAAAGPAGPSALSGACNGAQPEPQAASRAVALVAAAAPAT